MRPRVAVLRVRAARVREGDRTSVWTAGGVLPSRLAGCGTALLDFLLPAACAACGGAVEEAAAPGPVCRNCRLALPEVPLPTCDRCGAPSGTGRAPACLECADWPEGLRGARAACLLESPARELVHALKYQGWRGAGVFMGVKMAEQAVRAVREADCVTPVPTAARNVRRRGYNQAHVIAATLAEALGVPLATCLERRRQAGTQTTLNPAQRKANVNSAFALAPGAGAELQGRQVVLVDDVLTTGATVLAAFGAMRPAQPAGVFAYAFARTVPLSAGSADCDDLSLPELR